jgi:hypothetical protein
LQAQLKLKEITAEIITSRPPTCGPISGTTPSTTPIDKLTTSTNDINNVNTANQELTTKLDATRDTIGATGAALLKDFTPLVLAIISNNDNKLPSIRVTVELVASVPGTPVTSAHLTAYCTLLTETVFPKITKYNPTELINCKMVLVASSAKRQANSGNIYTASADPTDEGVSRVYGNTQSSANTFVVSVFAVICMFAFLFM